MLLNRECQEQGSHTTNHVGGLLGDALLARISSANGRFTRTDIAETAVSLLWGRYSLGIERSIFHPNMDRLDHVLLDDYVLILILSTLCAMSHALRAIDASIPSYASIVVSVV